MQACCCCPVSGAGVAGFGFVCPGPAAQPMINKTTAKLNPANTRRPRGSATDVLTFSA